jgi:hypothetical protein
MHRWLMAGALGLSAAGLFLHTAEPVAAQAKNAAPGWSKDYAAAKLEAKKTGKPMFLVFR